MKNYIIFTDSACDIPLEKLNEWGVCCCCLTFSFVGSDKNYEDYQLPQKEFYDKMRAGAIFLCKASRQGQGRRRVHSRGFE